MSAAPQAKTILITGGTGFLGRALARALGHSHKVVLCGRNNEQNRMAHIATNCSVLPMDICRIESVRDAVHETRPSIIIHAAASKFVELAERHPYECIDVNVTGSENVARVAIETGVETVIGVSTDKAAPPVRNTYGLTKALMERLFCSLDRNTPTQLACVRFGNIAWSTGSVFPIWKKMLAEEGVIGSTGPDCRRFFFSVDEAAQLVITAVDHIGEVHGRVLSRVMKAAQIRDILDVWIKHYGGSWKQIDERPGDQRDEDLIGEVEVPNTQELQLNGIPHYLISFNQRAERPISHALTSGNATRLSPQEILSLIKRSPKDAG